MKYMAAKLSWQEWLDKFQEKHQGRYDYSLVDETNIRNRSKIPISCLKHGIFYQIVANHALGQGCGQCAHLIRNTPRNIEFYIHKAQELYDNKYNYSQSNISYTDSNSKITIICPNHGPFIMTFSHHISQKQGCPKCRSSKGEIAISKFLDQNKILYVTQKTFPSLRGQKGLLKFDFYLPSYPLCIEYDGRQHFVAVDLFGGQEAFLKTQQHDKIKNQFCSEHNIKLIRISYTEDINQKLKSIFLLNPMDQRPTLSSSRNRHESIPVNIAA